jgi:hypothetical protein
LKIQISFDFKVAICSLPIKNCSFSHSEIESAILANNHHNYFFVVFFSLSDRVRLAKVGARKLRVDSEIKNKKVQKIYPLQEMKKDACSLSVWVHIWE